MVSHRGSFGLRIREGASKIDKEVGASMPVISLAVFLFTFWLALSGHYTPILIGAGAGCTLFTVFAARRMRTTDREGHPIHLIWGAVTYWPWLAREIAKSAWAVTKIILHPRLPISPTMTVVHASQQSSVGIATYANSITLTPGTITVGARRNKLTVHALVRDGALDLEAGGMDARVSQFEREG
jgi:multicomponent Na+:H+ antiporter subunit E